MNVHQFPATAGTMSDDELGFEGFQAQYGQRLADHRRRAYYRSCERREMGWLFVVAILVGVVVGIAVASGAGL